MDSLIAVGDSSGRVATLMIVLSPQDWTELLAQYYRNFSIPCLFPVPRERSTCTFRSIPKYLLRARSYSVFV